tara:strand:- start:7422 stop:9269 length:1848 start_codon:yes stop_codon:yes gene_type:complete
MSIKKILSSKDSTITNAFKSNLSDTGKLSNMGKSDILEVFSIFGQTSSNSIEKTRILIQFEIDKIKSLRDSGQIPETGKVSFVLKMHNAEHNQTAPEDFYVKVTPVLHSWDEGYGLDMEGYVDKGECNWISGSLGDAWANEGSDYINPDYLSGESHEKTHYFKTCDEDLEVDITSTVEQWLSELATAGAPARSEITFSDLPQNDESIEIRDYAHFNSKYTFSRLYQTQIRTGSDGTCQVKIENNVENTINNFVIALRTMHGSGSANRITVNYPEASSIIQLTQSQTGFSGNTKVVSSLTNVTVGNFEHGTKLKNYGLAIALSGNYEDGSLKRSFYTKKFFARSSEFQLKRPSIEIRWDSSLKDDRSRIYLSSSALPGSENLYTVAFYNYPKGRVEDVPGLHASNTMNVEFYKELGGNPVALGPGGDVQDPNTSARAYRHSRGIYKSSVSFNNQEVTGVYDVWSTGSGASRVEFHTGSFIKIRPHTNSSYLQESDYLVKIKNLKPEYSTDEVARLRLYSRDRNSKPNIYTVATSESPINIIENMYYSVKRASDGFVVVPYSTGSVEYSKLSYDSSGSYFDLDMSLLQRDRGYEISFLYKDGNLYKKMREVFKFRVM